VSEGGVAQHVLLRSMYLLVCIWLGICIRGAGVCVVLGQERWDTWHAFCTLALASFVRAAVVFARVRWLAVFAAYCVLIWPLSQ
jgi:hypothetical protein